MAIPQCVITCDDLAALIGVTGTPLEGTEVWFTPNITNGEVLAVGNVLYRVENVRGVINAAGELEDLDGNPGVTLLANDVNLGLDTPLQWQASFSHVVVQGFKRTVRSFWFESPGDGETEDLAALAPPPGQYDNFSGRPAPRLVGGYFNDDGDLVLINSDDSELSPITPADGVLFLIDNGNGTVTVG